MIINFNDLQLPFHRLAPGTILIDPDDIRYMKLGMVAGYHLVQPQRVL